MPSLNLSDLRNIVENEPNLADIVQTNLKPIQNELDLADTVQTNLKPAINESMNLISIMDEIRTKRDEMDVNLSTKRVVFSFYFQKTKGKLHVS